MSHMKHFEHLKISLEAIKSATKDFSKENCIGQGGFGEVYKGEIIHSMGKIVVALKRLNRKYGQGDPEFWKEIIMLSSHKHENIISLLGYCDECGEKILVYEYASNKSLDLYLHSSELTWVRRLNICIGAARGLMSLHNAAGAQQRVLHRDIKSSNILLDENWNAKISDFATGFLTKESDVYSFGVVLFEVLSGRFCFDKYKDSNYRCLVRLARKSYEHNKLDEVIHSTIKDEISSDSLVMFTTIAYQCSMIESKDRPLMTKVVKALEGALQTH
nr:protein kinase, ATP binding site-containing protein [Tanacetum cinerariifolium]